MVVVSIEVSRMAKGMFFPQETFCDESGLGRWMTCHVLRVLVNAEKKKNRGPDDMTDGR